MTRRNRIFIGILVAYALGVAFLMFRELEDIDPRYRESAEESLVETAQLMASLIEQSSADGALRVAALEPVFRSLYARRFSADIYGIEKTRVELRMTVVDRRGTVVFDSRSAVARRRSFAVARRLPRPARPVRRAHHGRHRRRPAHLGDVRRGAGPRCLGRRRRRDHRRGQPRQAGAELRPVRRGGTAQDAARRRDLRGRGAGAGRHPLGLAGPAVRAHRRLRALRARAALVQPAAPRPARARRDRRRLRRDARRARRPQLRRRLRADADPRGEGAAVGDPRRRRAAAGADGRRRPAPASSPASRARPGASRSWSTG